MKITLTGEESLRLEPAPGMLTIEASSADRAYSPFHMVASGLGSCTFSVLQSWASNKNIGVDDLKIDVSWKFLEGEHRFEGMSVRLDWPSLSAELWPRALRAAQVCGVHQTLTHTVPISVEAAGTESPAIEGMPSSETRGSRPAPLPQADGQPREMRTR
ncbi:MAG TPA: OsmC family protein [Gemmatimonadaceae bacterium]|nr:OsmC family protein [Gemmatimonadaceae bacterium]